MAINLKLLAIAIVSYVVLDGLWLGLLMKRFYRNQLAPIARLAADGSIAPNWPAAILVYVLLGAGVALFAVPSVPRSSGIGAVAAAGALFGLIVYGVYDLTNFATLRQWPLAVVAADIGWGVIASAACAVVVRMASR